MNFPNKPQFYGLHLLNQTSNYREGLLNVFIPKFELLTCPEKNFVFTGTFKVPKGFSAVIRSAATATTYAKQVVAMQPSRRCKINTPPFA